MVTMSRDDIQRENLADLPVTGLFKSHTIPFMPKNNVRGELAVFLGERGPKTIR